jgi:hypothetical protein
LLFLAGTAAFSQKAEIFSQIDHIFKELPEITGLAPRRRVAYEVIDRSKVQKFLESRVKEAVKPEEARAEELTLKKLGFIPQDYNLEKSTVDLLTEQAAAFYDFKKKKLFLTNWGDDDTQEMALIHELAHALADQHFDLKRFNKESDDDTDDSALAHLSVMEGQASWLTAEVLARRRGRTLIGNPEAVDAMMGTVDSSQFPVYEAAPLYLRVTLLFPYTQGLRFQNAVVEKLGKEGFAEVFRKPPISSQQILHPEAYFGGVRPVKVELPPIPKLKGFRTLAEGMIGELDEQILLEQYGSKELAKEIAPHWKGGAYALTEDKKRTRTILQYAVAWDGEEWAQRYFAFYRSLLGKKWTHMQIRSETPNELAGAGDDGLFVLQVRGNVVTSLEGLPAPQ